jgi:hypothetical protein
VPPPGVLAQPDTELREPSHSSEDQVSGSDTVLGTHMRFARMAPTTSTSTGCAASP